MTPSDSDCARRFTRVWLRACRTNKEAHMRNIRTCKDCTPFIPTNVKVLCVKDGGQQVWFFENEFKGKRLFNIRLVYRDANGEWCPGKGVSVDDPEMCCEMIRNISQIKV